MHTTNQLLDALAEKNGGATDYRLSKLLGTSTSAVANWRHGRSSLSQDYALKVAELLGWHPEYVVACVERERAEKDARLESTGEILAVWDRIGAKFRPKLAVILIAGLLWLGGTGTPVNAAVLHPPSFTYEADGRYIMRSRGRGIRLRYRATRRRRERRHTPNRLAA